VAAYVHHVRLGHRPLATGNWGCGAFGGDPQFKSLIQLIATSLAERDIVYFTHRNETQAQELQDCYNILQKHNISVGK